jgi:hypothetical protein
VVVAVVAGLILTNLQVVLVVVAEVVLAKTLVLQPLAQQILAVAEAVQEVREILETGQYKLLEVLAFQF